MLQRVEKPLSSVGGPCTKWNNQRLELRISLGQFLGPLKPHWVVSNEGQRFPRRFRPIIVLDPALPHALIIWMTCAILRACCSLCICSGWSLSRISPTVLSQKSPQVSSVWSVKSFGLAKESWNRRNLTTYKHSVLDLLKVLLSFFGHLFERNCAFEICLKLSIIVKHVPYFHF